MVQPITLRIGSRANMARYVAKQLGSLYPSDDELEDLRELSTLVAPALERMRPILNSVKAFDHSVFNHLHSMQYATFLYLLANEAWRLSGHTAIAERLFCLNKTLNSIDLFYAVAMPEVFLISHGLGTVLGNVTYGERLVVFQGVTVGRVGEDRPSIGANVVLFPGAVVTGETTIGDNSVVAAGTVLHGVTVPANVVSRMKDGRPAFTPCGRDYAALYFRSAD